MLKQKYFVAIALILMCLLSSCMHVRAPDGPPNFYVDETRIPNAVPRLEPLSKYGNMRYYYVFGKRYHVLPLPLSRNYDEVGVASWYGTKFHARHTSSGERYNMLAMTAAHKSLPLPTYVEVTNLRNQREIIVKVNGRGPFASNRIIDLSYVAAKKIGMLGHGTTLVRVKAIDTRPMLIQLAERELKHSFSQQKRMRSVTQPQLAFNPSIYLHVGSFRNKAYALHIKQQLTRRLTSAPVHIFSLSRQHAPLYKVNVGPLKNTQTAAKISKRLRTWGIKTNTVYGA